MILNRHIHSRKILGYQHGGLNLAENAHSEVQSYFGDITDLVPEHHSKGILHWVTKFSGFPLHISYVYSIL